MNDGLTVSLPARQLFALPDASCVNVLCTAGCLWLTLDDDARDVILHPGDSFRCDQPRRALLYATERSDFVLSAKAQGPVRRTLSNHSADCSRSPVVWAATRVASPG